MTMPAFCSITDSLRLSSQQGKLPLCGVSDSRPSALQQSDHHHQRYHSRRCHRAHPHNPIDNLPYLEMLAPDDTKVFGGGLLERSHNPHIQMCYGFRTNHACCSHEKDSASFQGLLRKFIQGSLVAICSSYLISTPPILWSISSFPFIRIPRSWWWSSPAMMESTADSLRRST